MGVSCGRAFLTPVAKRLDGNGVEKGNCNWAIVRGETLVAGERRLGTLNLQTLSRLTFVARLAADIRVNTRCFGTIDGHLAGGEIA